MDLDSAVTEPLKDECEALCCAGSESTAAPFPATEESGGRRSRVPLAMRQDCGRLSCAWGHGEHDISLDMLPLDEPLAECSLVGFVPYAGHGLIEDDEEEEEEE